MRGQGIDLGDVGHGGGKRRADRATGADDIVLWFVIGELNEAMGDVIGDRIAMVDDAGEFALQTFPSEVHRFQDFGVVVVGIVVPLMEMLFA